MVTNPNRPPKKEPVRHRRRNKRSKKKDRKTGKPIAMSTGEPDRRGRAVAVDTVRVNATLQGKTLVFAISEDIMDRLIELHNRVFRGYMVGIPEARQKRTMRMLFVRFIDMGMPAVMIRIEEPTFDPKGLKIWRPPDSRRWFCQIRARRIGVRDGITPQALEHIWMDQSAADRGLILIFNDADMLHVGPKTDIRKLFGRSADPWDLRA